MANGNWNGVFQKLAVWALAALLTGAWAWTRAELAAQQVEQARLHALVDSDHDDVTRLKEIVPRVERELAAIKAQNEEILRRLPAESRR